MIDHRPCRKPLVTLVATAILALAAAPVLAESGDSYCGKEGVWIQILGAGGPEIDDTQAGPSYLVWIDNHARLLVDTGPGSAVRYDEAGADFNDLDAIAFNHLQAAHTVDLPGFIEGSAKLGRDRPLPVFGPTGSDEYPDTETFVARLIGPMGAYPYLADFLTYRSSGGYKVEPRNVPATGSRRWARFGNEYFRLSAMPVQHGMVPAVAWRVDIGDQSIVFAGDFSNAKDVVADFADHADALVVSHAIPDNARGEARELFATPSQIGRTASRADVRMVILGHRTNRTRGVESQSRAAIEASYKGSIIFADDLECWGL
ncbi:MAG: MBL fold metallo-hydrolase [Pseudomonadales bacterium]|jgi:ribonuclease BN (tRNA processing enzyme)